MLEIIIIALAVVVVAILIVAATKPNTFRVERTATIAAPPEKVFPLINDFTRWRAWSPYENRDPAMRRSCSGAASGPGAVYEWDGNSKVGKGRITITDAAPPRRITLALDMIKPMQAHNVVDFTLAPRAGATDQATGVKTDVTKTDVTWAMRGACSFPAKLMHVFFSVDKMVGRDFEQGLANLKALAEG